MISAIRKLRTVAYFSRVWASGLAQQLGFRSHTDRMLRPRITGQVPRSTEPEVEEFIVKTGGSPDLYRDGAGQLLMPHTYFTTWALAELARALLEARLPLNFTRLIHATSAVRVHRLQTVEEAARFTATVETVVRTGKRVRIEQQLRTTTPGAQQLSESTLGLVLPDKRPRAGASRAPGNVPPGARLLTSIQLSGDEGWQYAWLSGDFNPVHWAQPVARIAGLQSPIAHGFDLMTRGCHAAIAHLCQRDATKLKAIELSFRRPVALPSELHMYAGTPEVSRTGSRRIPIWLSLEPESPSHMVGHVEIDA
ncbi:MAG: hypothetical protein MUF54_20450 [Polyangiaceae bacterium]|nr:hypothetical protein [Polyangiaceae bacterium]